MLGLPPEGLLGGRRSCLPVFAGTGAYASIYRPARAAEFACLGTIPIPEPDHFFNCQEAAGNLTCSVNGSVLVANGVPTYQQAPVANWTTGWLGTAQTLNERWRAEQVDVWNVGMQSLFICIVAAFKRTAATQPFLYLSGDNTFFGLNNLGRLVLGCKGTVVGPSFVYKSGASAPTPHPFCGFYDRRTNVARLNTDQEELQQNAPSAAPADGFKGITGGSVAPPEGFYNSIWGWVGSKAETMIDRGGAGLGAKQLIGDLGWTLAY